MPLILDIALTHLRNRKRQTLVSVLGVAMGKDEYRSAPVQPAQRLYPDGAVKLRGLSAASATPRPWWAS